MAKTSVYEALNGIRAALAAYKQNPASARYMTLPLATGLQAYLDSGKTAGLTPEALSFINLALKDTDYAGSPTNAWYAAQAKPAEGVPTGGPNPPANQQGPGSAGNETTPQSVGLPPSPGPGGSYPVPGNGITGASGAGSETTPASVGVTPGQAAQNAATPALGPQPGGTMPPGGATFGPVTGTPGGLDAGQNGLLKVAAQSGQENNPAMRAILRQMGISDPSHMGPMGEFIAQKFAPLFASWLAAQQYAQGGGGDANVTDNMQGLMGQFAKLLSTPGAGAFGQFAQTAQSALGNPDFQGLLRDATSSDQQKMLNQLLGLKYSGAGDLLANASANRADNAYSDFIDANMGLAPNGQGGNQPAYTGRFYDWLNNGNQGKPDPRASLFGIGK